MTTTLNASTASGLVVTPDNSGNIVLQYNGVAAPCFGVYLSGNQTIGSTGNTKIAFNTEAFDTANCFDTSTYRFTPTVAGYYQFNVFIISTGTMTGAAAQVWKNGNSGTFANIQSTQVSGAITYGVSASGIMYMNGTTDYAEAYLYVAATTTVQGANGGSTFSGCLLRGA